MRVFIPSPLHSYTGGRAEVEASGTTLAELLADLDARYPGLRFRIVDEQDRIREHIRFFVGEDLARDLSRPIGPREEVHIIAALSGGSALLTPLTSPRRRARSALCGAGRPGTPPASSSA